MLAAPGMADESQKPTADQLRYFEHHIRPLLHSKCVKCHGEKQQKGDLRLDSLEAMLKGGESGATVVAFSPDESLLLSAVRYESFEMPPGKQLSPEEISSLETWIADGAAWPRVNGASVRLSGSSFSEEDRRFWSLQPLAAVQPPSTVGSWATDGAWAQTDIDRFIAEKLEAAKITPAPKAT